MTDEPRRAFFGLRTSVAYFASHTGFAKLDVRLKAAALLYDEVLLEGGVYECTITDGGTFNHVGPPIGPEQLRPLRTRRGVMAGMRIAKTGSTDYQTIMSGRTEQRYRAQFMSRYEDIEPLKADWIRLVALTDAGEAEAKRIAEEWTSHEGGLAEATLPDRSRWFQGKVHSNLNLDLAQAALIRAELLPDGLNAPLLRAKVVGGAARAVPTGERPLQILLPDITRASWADVAELRRFAGFRNLRAKLRELDDGARRDHELSARVAREFMDELDKLTPSWRGVGLKAGLTVLSAIPLISAGAEAVGLAKDVADQMRQRQDWVAALLRARHYLARSLERTSLGHDNVR